MEAEEAAKKSKFQAFRGARRRGIRDSVKGDKEEPTLAAQGWGARKGEDARLKPGATSAGAA